MIDTSIVRTRRGRPPGYPKTGGRKKGTPNKVKNKNSIERDALTLAGEGETPLAFMLRMMRDEKQTIDVRLSAAKAAAPYCHRILKAMEVTGLDGGPIEWRVTLAFD